MIQENDSIIEQPTAETSTHHFYSVAQILRSLPSNATPAQQDSAVQANMPQREIHYSTRPDTLHLPGHTIKARAKSVIGNPHYPGESFFDTDTMYQQGFERTIEGLNVDPVPYQLRNDDSVTGVLFICFIMSILVLANGHHLIANSFRNFFRNNESRNTFSGETRSDLHIHIFLLLQTVFLLGLLFFDYTQDYIPDAFYENSPYLLLGINFGIVGTFIFVQMVILQFVNWVFFSPSKTRIFIHSYVLLTSCLGLLLYPLCLLVVYFDLSSTYTWIYFEIAVLLYILLLMYKCYSIFFYNNYGILHLIVYFCSVELTPAFVLMQALTIANKSLIINF